MPMTLAKARAGAILLSCLLSAGLSGAAFAQAIERNPPAAGRALPAPSAAPEAKPADAGDTLAGPPLRSLTLSTSADATSSRAGASVIGEGVRVTPAELSAIQARYAGRPLTRAVIAAIQSDVSAVYQRKGYPFAAVSTPSQDLSAGGLHLRVVEFRVGKIEAKPEAGSEAVRAGVRLSPGDAIFLPTLQEDMLWLNRTPFRNTEASFRSGEQAGQTHLFLETRSSRRVLGFAGAGNTGSESTGWNRVYAGVQAGGLLLADSLVGYQFTISPEDIGGRSEKGYLSHALQAAAPTGPRSEVDLSVNWVQTHQTIEVFKLEETVAEAGLGYRFALSDRVGPLRAPTDLRLGLEARRQVSVLDFGDIRVSTSAYNVYQASLGASQTRFGRNSTTRIEAALRVSPGGLDDANSDERLAETSQGRVTRARYAYVTGSVQGVRSLRGGAALRGLVRVQAATDDLPRTEQMGLGGAGGARAYSYDDGAGDQAAALQVDYDFPAIALGGRGLQLRPSAFADAAWGKGARGRDDATLASLGLAAAVDLGKAISLEASLAGALADGPRTDAGDLRLTVRLLSRF